MRRGTWRDCKFCGWDVCKPAVQHSFARSFTQVGEGDDQGRDLFVVYISHYMFDIEPRQQLFYCYRGLKRPVREQRRQLLDSYVYGFVYQCEACVNATPESDKLWEEVHDRIVNFAVGEEEMFSNPRFKIHSLDIFEEVCHPALYDHASIQET